jgi:hypothetical protein
MRIGTITDICAVGSDVFTAAGCCDGDKSTDLVTLGLSVVVKGVGTLATCLILRTISGAGGRCRIRIFRRLALLPCVVDAATARVIFLLVPSESSRSYGTEKDDREDDPNDVADGTFHRPPQIKTLREQREYYLFLSRTATAPLISVIIIQLHHPQEHFASGGFRL